MQDGKELNAGAGIPDGVYDVANADAKALEVQARAAPIKLEANPSQASTKERWAIMLDEAHDSTDMSEVFAACNGRGYTYKRGVPVEVPPEILEIFDHAIYFRSVAILDDRTGLPNGLAEPKKIRRYPYTKFYMTINAYGDRVRELPKVETE